MAPVIRISDEVFRRLQALGEPLVDTPNSVIEKLLDAGGSRVVQTATPSQPVSLESQGRSIEQAPLPGLYLAPASLENLKATVFKRIAIASLKGKLSQAALTRLRAELGDRTEFNCWAMTASSRGAFDKMRIGDQVLFTPKGTGRFFCRATVIAKLDSQELGDLLWQVTPGRPWSLVYFLEDVRRVDLDKEQLVTEFGYARSFPVYGITRVQPERVRGAIERRGSLEAVLTASVIRPRLV